MYNEEKFIKFCNTDMFLKYVLYTHTELNPEVIFNSYVKDDSVSLREYNKFCEKN